MADFLCLGPNCKRVIIIEKVIFLSYINLYEESQQGK